MARNIALKTAIVASGRTQKDVAKRAGIDQWRLSRIVTADVPATAREKDKLAKILRRPVGELFEAVS